MVLLPKRPYINVERACKELGCDIDDLVDCWISREIDFYYMLQGERVSIIKNDTSDGSAIEIFFDFISKVQNDFNANQINIADLKIKSENNNALISFKAYGAFLISPIRSTQFLDKFINIISPEQAAERSRLGLLNGGFCFILYPNTKDAIRFDDIDHIDGLEFPISNLFVKRNDINKFMKPSNKNIPQDSRYWIDVAVCTQSHYIKQNIFIPKGKLAAKIASVLDVAQSTVMKDWFKDTAVMTESQFKKTNKHGNKPVDDFDLLDPNTGLKLNF